MRNETIISKGKYVHAQPEMLISLKQYMFVRNEKGKKHLMLRFCNERNELCTGFDFVLTLMDAKGKVISEERFESGAESYGAATSFGFDHPIPVDERCTDFRVRLLRASFGDYTYRIESDDVVVSYEKAKDMNVAAQADKKHRKRRVHMRKIKLPWLCAVIALLVLAVVFATFGYLLNDYMDGKIEFSLSGVKYEFVGGNQDSTEVEIVGYTGLRGNVLLPAEIEGRRVIGIRAGAFEGNPRVRNVRVESLAIPDRAFRNCGNLESVELVSVTTLGKEAFYNCDKLEAFRADTLESIGQQAFYECGSLRNVEISHQDPAKLLSIGESAFSNCYALENVSIKQMILYPETQNIFANDTALQTLYLRNFNYTIPNVEMTGAQSGLLSVLFGSTQAADMRGLKHVTIDYTDALVPAFCAEYPALESVAVTSCEIADIPAAAFRNCTSLQTLSVPNAIATVGDEAFKNTALTSFSGGSLTYIGNRAFENCTALTEISLIKDGLLASIGSGAFAGCSSLKSFTVPVRVTELPDAMLKGCSSLERVEFAPNSVIESIPEQAFAECALLRELTLPSTVSVIMKRAFFGCASLPALVTEGEIAFYDESALEGCLAMEQIPMTDALQSIGVRAFAGSGVRSATVPASVELIGLGAFEGCMQLTEINVPYIGANANGTINHFSHIFGAMLAQDGTVVPSSLRKVTVSGELTSVAEYAFYGCRGVESILLPESVTDIGAYAFADCAALASFDLTHVTDMGECVFLGSGLRSAVVPAAITSLPRGTFSGCVALAEVTLPNTLESIGADAFHHCEALEAIAIPNTVNNIGSDAFSYCTALRSITLPTDITVVPTSAFASCTSLCEVNFPTNLQRIDANAFSGCTALTAVSFPTNLRILGDSAFSNTGLTTLVLPASLQTMGFGAFSGCRAITQLTVPFVGAYANDEYNSYLGYMFGGANAAAVPATLKKVFLQGGGGLVVYPGSFSNCANIEEIVFGEGVVQIYSSAAYACPKLVYVSLPASLNSLSSYAFERCYRLFEVQDLADCANNWNCAYALEIRKTEQARSPRVTVGNYCFALYSGNWYLIDYGAQETALAIPDSVVYQGNAVKWKLPKYFFYENSVVKTVTLPAAVKEVGEYAFAHSNVESVVFHTGANITTIYENTFYYAQKLRTVTLPNAVTSIGSNAFYQCQMLEALGLPSSLQTVEPYAFSYCNSLKQLTLPAGTQYVGEYAFANCYSLETVTLSAQLHTVAEAAFAGCTALKRVTCGNALTTIQRNAFGNCYSMEQIALSSSLESIGDYAFQGCRGLTQIALPGSLMRIGDCAFQNCDSLLEIVIPNSVSVLGVQAFYNCDALTRVVLSNALQSIPSQAFYNCDVLQTVVIPHGISVIGSEAFRDCDALAEITIPDSVLEIQGQAFNSCDALTRVVLSSAVTKLGSNAFYGCTKLYDVYYTGTLPLRAGYVDADNSYIARYAVVIHTNLNDAPSTEITVGGDLVFRHWNGYWLLLRYTGTRTELSFPNLTYNGSAISHIRIAESVFAYNSHLKKLVIGAEVKQIQAYAFRDCDALVEITMSGNGLTELEGYAFQSCNALRRVVLASSIEKIGNGAFYDCAQLRSIEMPTALTTIGSEAFYNCQKLLSVTLHQNVSSIGSNAFRNCVQLFEVYDLCSLSISAQSSYNGYVAYNAKQVFTSLSGGFQRKTEANCTFVLIGSTWYLHTCDLNLTLDTLKLPTYTGNLVILADAFEGASIKNLFLPANLTSVGGSELWDIRGLQNIYYLDNASKWSNISGRDTYATVWYYSECIHESGRQLWTYDSKGGIQTTLCTLTWSVTTQPGCTTTGEKTGVCDCGCGYKEYESLSKLGHNLVDEVCTRCGAERTFVTEENFEQLVLDGLFENDAAYAFKITGNEITSVNKKNNSFSTLTFYASGTTTVGFYASVSSQQSRDFLLVCVNGIPHLQYSGVVTGQSYEVTLRDGDTLEIIYSKDASGSAGEDRAWIQNMYFISN